MAGRVILGIKLLTNLLDHVKWQEDNQVQGHYPRRHFKVIHHVTDKTSLNFCSLLTL